MAAAAFFDLDRTLLGRNSASAWLRYELAAGHVGIWDAMRALGWLGRYSLGAADLEGVLLESIAALRGRREQDVVERTTVFYGREVKDHFRPGGAASLREHRQRGDKLVLLTSSSSYLSALVARELALDDYLCTRLEVDADGLFTGRPVCLCFGKGKVEEASRWAAAAGVSLSDSVFYTDSASDLPMLEAVGRAVAVNPDPRLARIARERAWTVADWGEAATSRR